MEKAQKIEVGSIIEGKVTKVKPFGVLVLLPNRQQGLVHISHVSNQYIENLETYIDVDEIIKVKVLSVDENNKKISLSMKEVLNEPKKNIKKYEHKQNKPTQNSENSLEDKISNWLKSSNEIQTTLNRRNKRR